MLKKLKPGRPGHATIVAYLALFVALGGTSAYAANTVFSTDIVDGEVKAADIGVGQVLGSRIADGTIKSEDVADNRLTGADIDETQLRVAQGAGTRVLGGRATLTPGESKLLFTIPGLGEIHGDCHQIGSGLLWLNTSGAPVDSWSERESGDSDFAQTTPHGYLRNFASNQHFSGQEHYTELSVGRGASGSPRRVATVHGFAQQSGADQPCTVQASGIYWDSAG